MVRQASTRPLSEEMQAAAFIAIALWLGVLTMLMLMVIRQVGLLTVRLDRGAVAPVDAGAELGSEISSRVGELVGERPYVLIFSAGCGPCRELATALAGVPARTDTVAVISGREESASDLAQLLPEWVAVVRGRAAQEVVDSLDIRLTPFVFELRDNEVSGKAALKGLLDLEDFMAPNGIPLPQSR